MWRLVPTPPPRFGSMSMVLDAHTRSSGTARHRGAHAEEAQLARVLQDEDRHKLLMFYSSRCLLCKALLPRIEEAEEVQREWLGVALLNTDNDVLWAPEMLHYQVEHTPCLVLLAQNGDALCKTTRPRNLDHMERCLAELVTMGKRRSRRK